MLQQFLFLFGNAAILAWTNVEQKIPVLAYPVNEIVNQCIDGFIIRIIYLHYIYIFNMKVISLNLDEMIFSETEKIVALMKKPRNRYINEAI